MALQVKATLTVNQASDTLTLLDTTGVYNAVSNVTGYGAPNRAVANNIVTELVPTFPDGSAGTLVVLDATTIPASNWIPKNALSLLIPMAMIGWTGDEYPLGLIKMTYRPWFTTASNGLVGVTNGSVNVTRQSAQDFTVDFADSYKIRIDGVNYTIAPGGIAAATLTLTTPYAGATSLVATAYIGYEALIAAVIDRTFKACLMPRYIANRTGGCDKSIYSTLIKLRYQWDVVYALWATPDFDAANQLLIDIGRDCDCLASNTEVTGCSTCL